MAKTVDNFAIRDMRQMRHAGKTIKEIALAVQLSPCTVLKYVPSLPDSVTSKSQSNAIVLQMKAQGYSVVDIAQRAGIDRKTVDRITLTR